MSLAASRKRLVHDNPVAKAFGQRVNQIRIRKHISIRDLAELSCISKGIIEAILKGVRYPEKSEEKNKLASALGVNVQQLVGEDSNSARMQLDGIIRSKSDNDHALELIKQLKEKALCLNDDLDVLYYYGRVMRGKDQLEEAHRNLQLAFSIAVDELNPTDTRFIRACNELVQFYFYSNDIVAGMQFLKDVEQKRYFDGNTFQQATLAHYKGTLNSMKGDLIQAEDAYRIALTLYSIEGRVIECGQVESSLGTTLYLLGKIDESILFFEKSILNLEEDVDYNKCVVRKEYCRALIDANKHESAMKIIKQTLKMINEKRLNFPVITAKLYLMLGDISQDPETVCRALEHENLPVELIINAHDILSRQYAFRFDAEKTSHHHSVCVELLSGYTKRYLPYGKGDWF